MAIRKFLVIGLGNFGAAVARELSTLDCEVTAVDQDKAKVQALVDDIDLAIVGEATDREFLENLQVEHFDCVVVSTGKDSHASILIALHLRELHAGKIVVKANSRDHAKVLVKVGASEALIPEEQMAIRLARSLAQPNMIDHLPLTADYSVAELVPPDHFVGKRLMDLQLRADYHVQVVAVRDSVSGELEFAPGGDYMIASHDILVVLGKQKDIDRLRD